MTAVSPLLTYPGRGAGQSWGLDDQPARLYEQFRQGYRENSTIKTGDFIRQFRQLAEQRPALALQLIQELLLDESIPTKDKGELIYQWLLAEDVENLATNKKKEALPLGQVVKILASLYRNTQLAILTAIPADKGGTKEYLKNQLYLEPELTLADSWKFYLYADHNYYVNYGAGSGISFDQGLRSLDQTICPEVELGQPLAELENRSANLSHWPIIATSDLVRFLYNQATYLVGGYLAGDQDYLEVMTAYLSNELSLLAQNTPTDFYLTNNTRQQPIPGGLMEQGADRIRQHVLEEGLGRTIIELENDICPRNYNTKVEEAAYKRLAELEEEALVIAKQAQTVSDKVKLDYLKNEGSFSETAGKQLDHLAAKELADLYLLTRLANYLNEPANKLFYFGNPWTGFTDLLTGQGGACRPVSPLLLDLAMTAGLPVQAAFWKGVVPEGGDHLNVNLGKFFWEPDDNTFYLEEELLPELACPQIVPAEQSISAYLIGSGCNPQDQLINAARLSYELCPNNINNLGNLGIYYASANNFAQAESTLNQAVAICPGSASLRLDLAYLLIKKGEIEQAGRQLAEAQQIWPDYWATLAGQWLVNAEAGDLTANDQLATRMTGLWPDDRPTNNLWQATLLLHFMNALEQGDLVVAQNCLDQLANKPDESSDLLLARLREYFNCYRQLPPRQ